MTAEKRPVVSGLIAKRRELAGIIDQLQRQLDQYRGDLTHIDGVLRVLATDPTRRRSGRSALTAAIATSPGMNYRASVSACSGPRRASCSARMTLRVG